MATPTNLPVQKEYAEGDASLDLICARNQLQAGQGSLGNGRIHLPISQSEFYDGQKWQQAVYSYSYFYSYMPQAKVVQEGGVCRLHVQGMMGSVEVKRAEMRVRVRGTRPCPIERSTE